MMDDVDRIMALMGVAFDPAYGEAWSRAQVDSALVVGRCSYLLAGADGASPAAGQPAAAFALLRTTLDEGELLLFAVAPALRRRGLGTALLRRVMDDARARGLVRLLLEMRDGNSAEQLYRKHGFSRIGRRPGYYRGANNLRIDAITFAVVLS